MFTAHSYEVFPSFEPCDSSVSGNKSQLNYERPNLVTNKICVYENRDYTGSLKSCESLQREKRARQARPNEVGYTMQNQCRWLGTGVAALTAMSILGSPSAMADVGPGTCDGERPQFEDDRYQLFGGGQVAVGTQWRASDAEGVLTAYDLSGQSIAPTGVDWPTGLYSHPSWVRSEIGQIFGVALDDQGNVFVAHTAVYLQDQIGSLGGQPGQVYKIDSVTGLPTVFVTLPNNSDPSVAASPWGVNESYPGLGNLCFDVPKQVLYVTNFEDGRIYRISAGGVCLSTWDHATGVVADCTPENDDVDGDGIPDGAARLGERVWAVQSFNGRVYYSVWAEDAGARSTTTDNEIWSIECDAGGEFIAGTEKLEITMPPIGVDYSNPVSDISFGPEGQMMCAERSMQTDTASGRFNTTAHSSRALEFICENQSWNPSPNTFGIGVGSGTNSAGGCDYSYGASPDDRVWVTGDALRLNAPDNVYGIQGLPQSGGNVANSILIDMDADIIQQDKTGIGSVEVSCPGDEQDPCATVTNGEILCDLDGSGNYTYTFDLTNNSGRDVKHLLILPDSGFNPVPSGLITLPTILPDTGTTQVSITFNGGSPGDVFCFIISLNTVDFEECCAIRECIEVPDCDCAQIHDEIVEALCDGSGCFTYTFDVDNLVGIPIYHSYFIPLTPTGVTIDTGNTDPSRWDYSPIPYLGTETVTITICGAQPGEEVCFLMTMHDAALDECCSIEICVTVPDCDPAGLCLADCNGDGELNFFDVSEFLSEFIAQEPRADMNDDGAWNFFDVSAYLTAFAAGCP